MSDTDEVYSCLAEAYEASEDCPLNPARVPSLGDLVAARLSRRKLLKGALGLTVGAALAAAPALAAAFGRPNRTGRFGFREIQHGVDANHHVAPGYRAEVLLRWGDPVAAGAPTFDPYAQSAARQLAQFGYNNDFIGYIPLPFGSGNSSHGLLCVNHEYTNEEVMFPGLGRHDDLRHAMTPDMVEVEMACHGGSIVEVKRVDGRWTVVSGSRYARRISALHTEIRISGPAAGHARLRTSADPSGTRVMGTVNNCAGGITPWGTYLMAEENFHGYFWGNLETPVPGSAEHPERANYARYGVPGNRYAWGRFHKRFDIHAEPNEANRFGWIVEVDPFSPHAVPVKRTALGRFKHEGAECILNGDGRLVLYSGDDQRFEYLYRFVSARRVSRDDRAANRDLLDEGILSVARFEEDGGLTWLPLRFGEAGLTPANGFHSQADVLIETRRAAGLLGATPMDRPEDVEPNPVNGRVYVMLTNNARRRAGGIDAANPRADNRWGHILELTPPDGDHASERFAWDLLLRAGDPDKAEVGARWNPATTPHGWFACPDNCAVDPQGGLWVATDQGRAWSKTSGTADGLWAVETAGEHRGAGRMFFRVPVGAELCGPRFTPDGRTLFLAVQHPATDGTRHYPGFARRSTFEDPATRWPDFDPALPPRPSVVVITKEDGGVIGGY